MYVVSFGQYNITVDILKAHEQPAEHEKTFFNGFEALLYAIDILIKSDDGRGRNVSLTTEAVQEGLGLKKVLEDFLMEV